MRKLAAFAIVLVMSLSAYGADPLKKGNFVGPTKAVKPDRTAILDYNGTLGDDPKFDVQPKVEGFRVLKDFSGKLVILVTPGEENAGKTIVVIYGDNKDKKTVLESFSFEVESTGPKPPPPVPPGPPTPDDPTKIKYFSDFKAAYLVSPNSDALDKLIEVYTEMGNTTFSKRSDAATILKSITAKKIPDYATLRKVRDTCQSLLEKDVGASDSEPFDATKYKQFWTDVVTALKAVKAGK